MHRAGELIRPCHSITADGNVDLITDPINGNQDFGYDALDRLTSAIGPYGTGGATATFTYTYNQIGNMLSNPQRKIGSGLVSCSVYCRASPCPTPGICGDPGTVRI